MAALDKNVENNENNQNNERYAMVYKARPRRQQVRNTDGLVGLMGLAVLCGIGLLLALVVGASSNEAPTCGGNTMARGGRCVVHSGGGTYNYSYQEMLDREGTTDTIIRGFGWFLAWPSGALLVLGLISSVPWGGKVSRP